MKFCRYLMIVSLLFGFSVQATQENINGCKEQLLWRTCVNKEDPYDCEEIYLKWVVNFELDVMDNEIKGIRYHYMHRTFFCPYGDSFSSGKNCQKIIQAYEEGQAYEEDQRCHDYNRKNNYKKPEVVY